MRGALRGRDTGLGLAARRCDRRLGVGAVIGDDPAEVGAGALGDLGGEVIAELRGDVVEAGRDLGRHRAAQLGRERVGALGEARLERVRALAEGALGLGGDALLGLGAGLLGFGASGRDQLGDPGVGRREPLGDVDVDRRGELLDPGVHPALELALDRPQLLAGGSPHLLLGAREAAVDLDLGALGRALRGGGERGLDLRAEDVGGLLALEGGLRAQPLLALDEGRLESLRERALALDRALADLVGEAGGPPLRLDLARPVLLGEVAAVAAQRRLELGLEALLHLPRGALVLAADVVAELLLEPLDSLLQAALEGLPLRRRLRAEPLG